jgi:hypothetical protein
MKELFITNIDFCSTTVTVLLVFIYVEKYIIAYELSS